MEVIPLRTSTILKTGESIPHRILETVRNHRLQLRDGDIVAIASKAVAVAEGRVRRLDTFKPTPRAVQLARRYSLSPQFTQAVIDETDEFRGGVKGALLTVKKGQSVANAGIDQKNAPENSVVLWPSNPDESARKIREALQRHIHVKIGVIIVDSRVTPMRLGTVGLALGISGIKAVNDIRGKTDLQGRKVRITRHAIADDAASAAHLMMGEGAERVPFVIIRGAPVPLTDRGRIPQMNAADCLYMSQIASTKRP